MFIQPGAKTPGNHVTPRNHVIDERSNVQATKGSVATTPGGDDPPGAAVPEPGTMLLVGSGLAGAAWMRRRRKAQTQEIRAADVA